MAEDLIQPEGLVGSPDFTRSILAGPALYWGQKAVLATMHGKQEAIAPVMSEILGLRVTVTTGLDTDQLGTFTCEISREGLIATGDRPCSLP